MGWDAGLHGNAAQIGNRPIGRRAPEPQLCLGWEPRMANVTTVGTEARQSMMRVWLAISAVWVVFWLLIAMIVLAVVGSRNPFVEDAGLFALIIVLPPAGLLAVGAILRLLIDNLTRISGAARARIVDPRRHAP